MRQDAWKTNDRTVPPTWTEFDELVRRLGWSGTERNPDLPTAEWPAHLARVKALRHVVLEELSAAGLAPERTREFQENLLLGWQVVFQVWALQEGLFEPHDPVAAARKRDELRRTYLQRTGSGEAGT